jgi:hypothetical protein
VALILLFSGLTGAPSGDAKREQKEPDPIGRQVGWNAMSRMMWRWGRRLFGTGRSDGEAGLEPESVEDWESQLVERGVSGECAMRLAPVLREQHGELGRGSARGLIRGAVLASEIHAEAQAFVERNMRDVREVERLLGAFSGELEKLDEVLEVLSAYAQRMRAKPARPSRGMLH